MLCNHNKTCISVSSGVRRIFFSRRGLWYQCVHAMIDAPPGLKSRWAGGGGGGSPTIYILNIFKNLIQRGAYPPKPPKTFFRIQGGLKPPPHPPPPLRNRLSVSYYFLYVSQILAKANRAKTGETATVWQHTSSAPVPHTFMEIPVVRVSLSS